MWWRTPEPTKPVAPVRMRCILECDEFLSRLRRKRYALEGSKTAELYTAGITTRYDRVKG